MSAIFITALVVLLRPAAPEARGATIVSSADLTFEDAPDGSVLVSREPGHVAVATLAPTTNAFVRVTLAGIVQQRRRDHENDARLPFRLERWSDGRLTLDDAVTRHRIELQPFGRDNEAAFARLLDAANAVPADASPTAGAIADPASDRKR